MLTSDDIREQLAQQERELIQQSREIEELRAQLSQKEREAARINEDYSQIKRTAEELRAANEALTFYLNRYKRVKEKILPPGSWRENVVRRALRLMAAPSVQQHFLSAELGIDLDLVRCSLQTCHDATSSCDG